jgi:cytochrome c556
MQKTHPTPRPAVFILLVLIAISIHAASPALPENATNMDVMKLMVIPSSDFIWAAQEAPQDDAGWAQIRSHADQLSEAGNLLMAEIRAQEGETWSREAQALIEAARSAANAAADKNFDALSEAGEAMYNSCESCHAQYLKAKQ